MNDLNPPAAPATGQTAGASAAAADQNAPAPATSRATVGRIVHYRQPDPKGSAPRAEKDAGPAPRAALVVADVGGGGDKPQRLNLQVFNPAGEGVTFVRAAEEGTGAGQWSWPERA